MVSKAPSMNRAFRRFLIHLGRKIGPERVILFGSRAPGAKARYRRTSDYDLLIVSKRFRGVPWIHRAPLVIRLWDLPVDLEPICLTPEEFERRAKELSIVGEAVRSGVVVYTA